MGSWLISRNREEKITKTPANWTKRVRGNVERILFSTIIPCVGQFICVVVGCCCVHFYIHFCACISVSVCTMYVLTCKL